MCNVACLQVVVLHRSSTLASMFVGKVQLHISGKAKREVAAVESESGVASGTQANAEATQDDETLPNRAGGHFLNVFDGSQLRSQHPVVAQHTSRHGSDRGTSNLARAVSRMSHSTAHRGASRSSSRSRSTRVTRNSNGDDSPGKRLNLASALRAGGLKVLAHGSGKRIST